MVHPILILGCGVLSRRIADVLAADGRFCPTIADRDGDGLHAAQIAGYHTRPIAGPSYREALLRAMTGQAAVIVSDAADSAPDIAACAATQGCHYLDVLESAISAKAVGKAVVAAPATVGFAPGCGLAPGYVTALASADLAAAGPQAEVTVFVGVLPAHPSNRLGYANIWGVSGLIDEYTQPCLCLRDWALDRIAPLSEREEVEIGGQRLEAFTTAGSLDALAAHHAGEVRGLVFKTLRYPGHLDYIRFLLEDLGLSRQLYRLKSLLLSSLPKSDDDRVVIALRTVEPGRPTRWSERTLRATPRSDGRRDSAISTTTAAHVAAMLDLVLTGRPPLRGLIAPGAVPVARLRESPFFALLDREAQDSHSSGETDHYRR